MAMTPRAAWKLLGVPATAERTEIRRAYARLLKKTNPEDDSAAFQKLRHAYEFAMQEAGRREWWAAEMARREAEGEEPLPDLPDDDADGAAVEAVEAHADESPGVVRLEPTPPPKPVTVEEIAQGRIDLNAADEAPPPPPPSPDPRPASEVRIDPEPAPAVPESVQALQQEHERACQRILELLERGPKHGSEAARALEALFRSPAMDSIDLHSRTEFWLSNLIVSGDSRIDPLIDPAVRYFGWESHLVGGRSPLGEQVLYRRYEAELLRQFSRRGSLHNPAFRTLTRKPTGWNWLRNRIKPGLPNDVARLLRLIRHDHPHMERHLDPEAVDWWVTYLQRKRVGPVTIWAAAVVALCAAFSAPFRAIAGNLPEALELPFFVIGYPLAVLAMFCAGIGIALIRLYGLQWPRERWRERSVAKASPVLQFGWAPAALILAAAGICTAGFADIRWGLAGAAPLLWVWTRITSDVDTRPIGESWRNVPEHAQFWTGLVKPGMKSDPFVRNAVAFLPLLLFWTFFAFQSADFDGGTQVAIATSILAGVWITGSLTLGNLWARAGQTGKRIGLATTGIGILAAAVLLVLDGGAVTTFTAGVISLVVVLQKLIGFDLTGRAFMIREHWIRFGWLPSAAAAGFLGRGDVTLAVALGGWVLIGALIAVAGRALQEMSPMPETALSPASGEE